MKKQASFPLLIIIRLASAVAIVAFLMSCRPGSAESQGKGQWSANQGHATSTQSQGAGNQGGNQAGNPGGGRRSAVVTVQAETVKFGPLVVSNSTAGTVVAESQSAVAAQIAGTVTSLIRTAGDWVNAGAPIIQLDDSQAQLALKIAQANLNTAKLTTGYQEDGTFGSNSRSKLQLEAAQKNYEAALALQKLGGISGSDFDTAQANLQAAQIAVQQDPIIFNTASLQVQQAQLNLRYTTIRAPFSGQIVSINVQPGMYVSTNSTAFVMVSRAKIVNFNVPPSDVVGLTHGSKITYTQDGKSYPINLKGVPSAPINSLVPLQGTLPSGFPGNYGAVGSIAYTQVLAQGVLIPIPSIQTLENSTYVYIIKNDLATQADITIMADSGTYAAVTGITDGDTVIVNPPPGLLPGATVKVMQAAARQGGNGQNKGKWGGQ